MVSMREQTNKQRIDPAATDGSVQLAAIFDAALPKVYGYIYLRVSGDQTIAEDLTSETMLAFVRSWPQRQADVPDPIAWLIGIARNKVHDHYRTQTGRLNHQTDWPLIAEQIPDIADDLARIHDRDELIRLLDPLPSEQRIVLLLRYLDGYSTRETASLIGKSEHAVESLLARARQSVRTTMIRHQSEEHSQ